MFNCSQLSWKNNTHKHDSCIILLLIKSQLWLQVIVWAGLVLSIQCSLQLCRLLSAEIFLQSFQKSFVIECYNYIRLLTAFLQAVSSNSKFFLLFSQGFTQTLVFYFFFLDLFFFEISAIITALLLLQLVLESFQVRIQRLKEVTQTDQVPVFPLAGVWISRYTSIITCIALSSV